MSTPVAHAPFDAPSTFGDSAHQSEAPACGAIPPGISVGPRGRLREDGLPENDRLTAGVMHIWWLALALPTGPLAVAIPIVLWIWRKERSRFLDDHGREATNFLISQVILSLGLAITGVGVVLLPIIWVVGLVSIIRAAAAAWAGEYFRYPMTIRLIG